jgi:shikimate kinase
MTSKSQTANNKIRIAFKTTYKAANDSKPNIVLIGFMGAGKTSIGKILARKLNLELLETDELIQEKAGMSISQIFETAGEITFRELEIEAVKEISQKEHFVIASGGGIVLNSINIERLRQRAIIVYLYASEGEIVNRIKQDKNPRPLISEKNAETDVKELMKLRGPLYRRSADLIINTSNKDIELIAKNIISRLKKNENLDI